MQTMQITPMLTDEEFAATAAKADQYASNLNIDQLTKKEIAEQLAIMLRVIAKLSKRGAQLHGDFSPEVMWGMYSNFAVFLFAETAKGFTPEDEALYEKQNMQREAKQGGQQAYNI